MGRGANCSWMEHELPLSSEIFSAIKDELWLFLIPAGLAVILLAVFLEEVGFLLRHVTSSRRKRLYLWILGMYPVFTFTSLIALYIPRSSSVCNFIASLYHSISLLKFMGLITDFFGGKARMLDILSGEQVSPDPFPCCCCCCLPMIAINRSSRGWMMAAVLQLSVVRSILFFITLVLWTDEQYDYGDVDSVNPNLYVNGIIGVSTMLSFYGHLLFYKATRRALHGYGLRAKFVCIVAVLVLCGLQSGILETMGSLEVIPCAPPFSVIARSQLIYHYCVIVEMFCIGLFARHTFRKICYKLQVQKPVCVSLEGCGQFRNLSTSDIIVMQVEPRMGDDLALEERTVQRAQLLEKAVQTDSASTAGPPSCHSPVLLPPGGRWQGGGPPCHSPVRLPPGGRWQGGQNNPGYHSSDSEDSLCKIEHAPLDRFPFPLQPAPRRDLRKPGRSTSLTTAAALHDLSGESNRPDLAATVTVVADVNYVDPSGVTVV